MTNRPRFAFVTLIRIALTLAVLGSFEVASTDHFAVGAQAGVRGSERTALHARVEWGAHHGVRVAWETDLHDRVSQDLQPVPGEASLASGSSNAHMYSIAYEYSVSGRRAARSWFLGAGPSLLRAEAFG